MTNTTLASVLIVLASACAAEEPTPSAPPTEKLQFAPDCSDPGWGFGYEDQEINAAFESDSQCSGDPWGGGDSGGGYGDTGDDNSCPGATTFTGTAFGHGSEDFARRQAHDDAVFNAKSACMDSGIVCRPHVDSFSASVDCTIESTDWSDPQNPVRTYECSATASVACSYQWPF